MVVVGDDVLGHVENQMHTLLLSDAAHEGKKRHRIVQVPIVEVLHLQQLLGSDVIRSCGVKLTDSLSDRDSVRVSERLLFHAEDRRES